MQDSAATLHLLEAHDRITAARDLLDTMATGRIGIDADTLDHLAAVIHTAARHARLATGWPMKVAA